MQTEITSICNSINRRIKQMNYREETEVREHLNDNILNNKLLFNCIKVERIADILEVNENCIFDLLEDLKP